MFTVTCRSIWLKGNATLTLNSEEMTCHVRDYLNALHFVRCSFSLYAYQKFDVVHHPQQSSAGSPSFSFSNVEHRVSVSFAAWPFNTNREDRFHRLVLIQNVALLLRKISYALTSSGSASSRSSAFLRAATHGYSCLCLRLLSLHIAS